MFSISKHIWKTKLFPPTNFNKALSKNISNELLQKTSKVSPSVDTSPKPEEPIVTRQEESSQQKPDTVANSKLHAGVPEKVTEISSIVLSETSLMERKDYPDTLLNVDSFDDVPGPEILRKVASIWKYVPTVGCQATVSAILSFSKVSKFGNNIFGSYVDDRPFNKLFRKYGPIVKLDGPLGAQIVLISRPEHIAKVYDQEGKYPIRSTLDSVEKCRSQVRKSSGGTYNLSGVEWEEMRKAIEDPLMKGGKKYFQSIEEAATVLVKRIQAVRNRQNEVSNDLMTEINKWSLECLCMITLDKSLGFLMQDNTMHSSETSRMLKAVMDATTSICKCEQGFQFWRFMNTPASIALTEACETIDNILSKHIRYAQVSLSRKKDDIAGKGKHGSDMAFIESLLVSECMTPEEVLTCIVDVLLIGVNTSSSALGFMLYHLARNQRVQRVLFKEVKGILPEKQSKLEFSQLSSMPYLQACLRESLRLKMPMPILTRVLAADVVLSNFRIPKGTYVVMDAQAACMKETDFEKPEKFLPERWLESHNVHPFAFLPFGHGLRSCVGRYLAETQIKSCIAKLIRNYQIEYNYGDVHAMDTVISLPDKPLRLTFIDREE